ncbi:hypothetical protein [Halovenus marina]|uniref:hypothetical protein n=1 Tax=Halovenus marina TaxID=3396621 RepID=UPI003F564C4F
MTDGHLTDATARQEPTAVASADLFIRNFDTTRTNHLTVRVRDGDGIVFASRYALTPGKTECEVDRLGPGEYDVIVELDSQRRERATCRIGPGPEKTALVEIGNGTVSVTQGLYC